MMNEVNKMPINSIKAVHMFDVDALNKTLDALSGTTLRTDFDTAFSALTDNFAPKNDGNMSIANAISYMSGIDDEEIQQDLGADKQTMIKLGERALDVITNLPNNPLLTTPYYADTMAMLIRMTNVFYNDDFSKKSNGVENIFNSIGAITQKPDFVSTSHLIKEWQRFYDTDVADNNSYIQFSDDKSAQLKAVEIMCNLASCPRLLKSDLDDAFRLTTELANNFIENTDNEAHALAACQLVVGATTKAMARKDFDEKNKIDFIHQNLTSVFDNPYTDMAQPHKVGDHIVLWNSQAQLCIYPTQSGSYMVDGLYVHLANAEATEKALNVETLNVFKENVTDVIENITPPEQGLDNVLRLGVLTSFHGNKNEMIDMATIYKNGAAAILAQREL